MQNTILPSGQVWQQKTLNVHSNAQSNPGDAKHNESTEINCDLLSYDAFDMKASMNSRTDGWGDTFQEVWLWNEGWCWNSITHKRVNQHGSCECIYLNIFNPTTTDATKESFIDATKVTPAVSPPGGRWAPSFDTKAIDPCLQSRSHYAFSASCADSCEGLKVSWRPLFFARQVCDIRAKELMKQRMQDFGDVLCLRFLWSCQLQSFHSCNISDFCPQECTKVVLTVRSLVFFSGAGWLDFHDRKHFPGWNTPDKTSMSILTAKHQKH